MRTFAILAAAAFMGGGCTSPTAQLTTGLSGQVLRGPITPVCTDGVPCDAPFSATFHVQRGSKEVAAFVSDSEGRFLVLLPPGSYTVVPDASAPLLGASQQSQPVTVSDEGLTEVVLYFDTGIR